MKVKNHPAVSELKNELENCRKNLFKLIDTWDYYEQQILPVINFAYENVFGDLEEQIQSKTKIVAALDYKVEIFTNKVNRGETITPQTNAFVDAIIERKMQRHQDNSSFRKTTHRSTNNREKPLNKSFPLCDINSAYELQQIYRFLVKKMHPDVNSNSELFHRYWNSVQLAYKNNNLDRMRLFYMTFDDTSDSEMEDYKKEEQRLRFILEQYKKTCKEQEQKIAQAINSEPYCFEHKINDRKWVAGRRMLLRNKMIDLDKKINFYKHKLRRLTSNISINQSEYQFIA